MPRGPASRLPAARALILCLAGPLALAAGCGPSERIRIVVQPTAHANKGRPVFLVLRQVSDKAFLEESYQEIVDRAMAEDETTYFAGALLPGESQQISIPRFEKGTLAIYALFTDPRGVAWKTQVRRPLPDVIELEVDDRRLTVRRVRRRRSRQVSEPAASPETVTSGRE